MKPSESRYCHCMYFASGALARKVEKLAASCWKPVGLSPSHAYLLMIVLEEPGIQPGQLACHLQLQPSTVTRLIEKLEEQKLVVRTTEGKIANVYPTPKAKEMQPRLKACGAKFNQAYTSVLGKADCGRMVQQMTLLADKLE